METIFDEQWEDLETEMGDKSLVFQAYFSDFFSNNSSYEEYIYEKEDESVLQKCSALEKDAEETLYFCSYNDVVARDVLVKITDSYYFK